MKREEFDVPEFTNRTAILRRAMRYRDGTKRVMDMGLGVALLPIILPCIAVLWVLIRCDGSPAFYGHPRVGQNGQEFSCWKLRTMVPDAPQKLRQHLRENRAAALEWADNYKLKNDPRVTRLGRFLCATSLDELPQIWNVLRGEMSLVGPRLVSREELVEYSGFECAYFTFKPGMTGIWQVSGRNNIS